MGLVKRRPIKIPARGSSYSRPARHQSRAGRFQPPRGDKFFAAAACLTVEGLDRLTCLVLGPPLLVLDLFLQLAISYCLACLADWCSFTRSPGRLSALAPAFWGDLSVLLGGWHLHAIVARHVYSMPLVPTGCNIAEQPIAI